MARFLIMTENNEMYQADHLTEDDYISQREGFIWIFNITNPERPTEIHRDENIDIPKWEPG